MMRYFFDTNAIINTIVSRISTPRVALSLFYDIGDIRLSVPLVRELHDVVSRVKLIVK